MDAMADARPRADDDWTAETPDGQTESVTLDQSYDGAILPDDVRLSLLWPFGGRR